jgi:hypothetical protein
MGFASGAASRPVGATCGVALTNLTFSGLGIASALRLRHAA